MENMESTMDSRLVYGGRVQLVRISMATIAGLVGVAIIWLYNQIAPTDRKITLSNRGKWRLPPGPNGIPIIGNLAHFARIINGSADAALIDLASHGEMTTVRLGSRTWVFLNTHRVANEIISKRGNITAERNFWPIAGDIVGRGRASILSPISTWTEPRRLMHRLLSGSALTEYSKMQETESTQLMAEYLFHPAQWYAHHFRYSTSVGIRIALGERIVTNGEDLAALQNVGTDFTGAMGASVVDWFPALSRLPRWMQFWLPQWQAISDDHNRTLHKWWDPVRDSIKAGTAPPSWVRDILLNPESKFTGDDEDAMYIAMFMIGAGGDTTRVALNIFVLAMAHYPDVLTNMREVVDAACDFEGGLRLPVATDMEEMPYVAAVIKEVLRWRTIFPTGTEHTLSKDLEFEGYRFPAGLSFVLNEASITQDCEDPETLKPERWLDGNEMNVVHGIWQFGGGRRICVGYRIAQRGLFINFARMAMCFDFKAVSFSPPVRKVRMLLTLNTERRNRYPQT